MIIMNDDENELSSEDVSIYLDIIFKNSNFKHKVKNAFEKNNLKFKTINELVHQLRVIFKENFKWHEISLDALDQDMLESIQNLNDYENIIRQSYKAYIHKKDNIKTIFWPNPEKYPEDNMATLLPYSKKHPILDKTTPIASAGSCFAFEIAYELQRKGFSYLVCEKGHQPEVGVHEDDHDPNRKFEKFSASYGILFNTASFKQLAERAFGLKEFSKLLIEFKNETHQFYMDPYRENVYFKDPQSFEKNYDAHTNAIKNVFLNAKVFVMTIGLNEAWEYLPDKAYISRNPSSQKLKSFLKQKVFSLQENINNLQSFIDIVKSHNPHIEFIISLSPVPLIATFQSDTQHVIAANAHSKAMLRVAIQEIVNANQNVHYLPSYEMVTTVLPDPWEADKRHVKRDAVQKIMTMFDEIFVKK